MYVYIYIYMCIRTYYTVLRTVRYCVKYYTVPYARQELTQTPMKDWTNRGSPDRLYKAPTDYTKP